MDKVMVFRSDGTTAVFEEQNGEARFDEQCRLAVTAQSAEVIVWWGPDGLANYWTRQAAED